jgi:fucose 4-O-acetylase-like acetyltransferase
MGGDAQRGRLHALDYIKAAAIVAVVFTHAGRLSFAPKEWGYDFVLTSLWTRFHVPSFLFVSGFLYARYSSVDLPQLWSRLSRVLIPYLIASSVAQLAGVTAAKDLSDVVRQFATASSLGVYYYIFIFIVCVLLIWPLSRAGRVGASVALLVCFGIGVAFVVDPGLRPAKSHFWSLRDPLQHFALGYFLAGWVAYLALPKIVWLHERRAPVAAALCTIGILLGLAATARLLPVSFGTFDRVVYTFSVIGMVAVLTHQRPAGPIVRFLGDASLAIYLYHRIFQLLLQPVSNQWHELARIAGQVAVGLCGASLVIVAGRRLLGAQRSRRWLGA